MLLMIACNLGASSNAPPTLAPLPTFTPQATLGYAAVRPVVIDDIEVTAVAPSDELLPTLLEQVESDRLMAHIRSLQDFRTRHIGSAQTSVTEGIGAARKYIKDQLEIFGSASGGNLYTFEQSFEAIVTDIIQTRQHNIIGAISGSEVNAGTIIIGAHYDSIGEPRSDGRAYAPGANDNASGVAALLEIARILSIAQYRATIMFVLFSAEEFNRQGSIPFAVWVRDKDIDVIGMINVDTIGNVHDFNGNRNDRQLRVFSAGPNDSSVSRKMAREANFLGYNYELKLDLRVQDEIDRENRYGDHFSFSELGYPAIRLINAYEEKRNADPTDTIEFIEPDYLRRATQSILAIVISLADGPRPPVNIVLRARDD
ncbi:MAG: M20/M25/M40 family metallo-hydrolase, partial [Anaerolineae bacterium]|nr:M20/M25/M40 family metallo-hydrolase [Anaerolineae bacterium]